jgi:para-aminobenzoate synthetase/4-amino-4-deoxychorismate lyase
MQAITQLEPQPRGVYCGAVGIIQPGGASTFSVAIRTATVKQTAVQCGIGSGITIGATAAQEWQEWQHKQGFLERARQPFELLETLALVNGQLPNAHAHLQRMQAAAAHFGFCWNLAQAQACLDELASAHPTGHWRVRLLWHAQGKGQAQAFASEASPAHVVLQLATHCFESAHSEFVFYKTTRRAHYDAHAPQQTGVFDTVLWNAQGEITECTRGNIAACINGQWLTPPLASGLLGGIGRQQALVQGRIQEGIIRLDDLSRATQWAFINSLRGWIDATVLASDLALWPKP